MNLIPCEECAEMIEFSVYEKHKCPPAKVPCEHCSKQVNFDDFASHSCSVALPCEICSKLIPVAEYARHLSLHETNLVKCDICDEQVEFKDFSVHAHVHQEQEGIVQDQELQQLKRKYQGSDQESSYSKRFIKGLEREFEKGNIDLEKMYEKKLCAIQGTLDSDCVSSGYIKMLASTLERNSDTLDARLCNPATMHYCVDLGDRGFGCGYRNFMMMMSSLETEEYKSLILQGLFGYDIEFGTDTPNTPHVQAALERAWSRGFDLAGRDQLEGKVVGTSKWIGPTEIYSILFSMGISCTIVDFHTPDSDGKHSRLLNFIKDYFYTVTADGYSTRLPPLYLQYRGHSITVIGYERTRDFECLLVFDPSYSPGIRFDFVDGKLVNKTRFKKSVLGFFRYGLHELYFTQYQVLRVDGIADIAGYDAAKVVKSTRIP